MNKRVTLAIIFVALIVFSYSTIVLAENGSNSDSNDTESNDSIEVTANGSIEVDSGLNDEDDENEIENDDSAINGSDDDENETEEGEEFEKNPARVKGIGTIKFLDIEGGCWVIETDNGLTYEPTNLKPALQKEGLRIEFRGRLLTDVASVCQTGELIQLTNLELKNRLRYILNASEKARIIRAEHRLRINASGNLPENCELTGSALKCHFENGTRTMIIYAGNSGNVIVQIKNVNASTQVTLYKNGEEVYGIFKNNETKKIILPDEVKERIKEKIKARLENETFNLTEDGKYTLEAKKRAKLFFLFAVKENLRAEVDAETGEVVRIRGPWWGFLASDEPEEERE